AGSGATARRRDASRRGLWTIRSGLRDSFSGSVLGSGRIFLAARDVGRGAGRFAFQIGIGSFFQARWLGAHEEEAARSLGILGLPACAPVRALVFTGLGEGRDL